MSAEAEAKDIPVVDAEEEKKDESEEEATMKVTLLSGFLGAGKLSCLFVGTEIALTNQCSPHYFPLIREDHPPEAHPSP